MDSKVGTALLLTSLGAVGTTLGGLLVVAQPQMDFKRLGYLQGLAAGLMFCISVLDLLPHAVEEVGFANANMWFYIGVVFFAVVVALVPEPSEDNIKSEPTKKVGGSKKDIASEKARKRVLLSGLITALGIALHNFPEGVAVFLASMKSSAVGVSLAVAIALHNIPEGVAVALPVYFATGSRWQGLRYAFVSGLAEPLAVVVLALVFPTAHLSKELIERLLAAVGGIMAFLCVHELLPLSFEHSGRSAATISFFVGMAIMSANLYILDYWIGGH